jgi:hypothetical protein
MEMEIPCIGHGFRRENVWTGGEEGTLARLRQAGRTNLSCRRPHGWLRDGIRTELEFRYLDVDSAWGQ